MKTLATTAALTLSMMGAVDAAKPLEILQARARNPVAAPAQHFNGTAEVEMLFTPDADQRTSAGVVTFQAGARTHWHTHPYGQTLLVTAGVGRVQRDSGPIQEIRRGDVVRIPADTRHWHGAAPTSTMTHLAIQEQRDGSSVQWLEAVTDVQYAPEPAEHPTGAQPSRAQQLLGDVAPKLAELTDEVLFGDVWARPGLSPRDRSLVTVSALIAMNRPEQLRSHLALARRNGLSETELVEALTQLAFYAGWPNAVTAVGVAREVFREAR